MHLRVLYENLIYLRYRRNLFIVCLCLVSFNGEGAGNGLVILFIIRGMGSYFGAVFVRSLNRCICLNFGMGDRYL